MPVQLGHHRIADLQSNHKDQVIVLRGGCGGGFDSAA